MSYPIRIFEVSQDQGLFKNVIIRIILLTGFEKNDEFELFESESETMSNML